MISNLYTGANTIFMYPVERILKSFWYPNRQPHWQNIAKQSVIMPRRLSDAPGFTERELSSDLHGEAGRIVSIEEGDGEKGQSA